MVFAIPANSAQINESIHRNDRGQTEWLSRVADSLHRDGLAPGSLASWQQSLIVTTIRFVSFGPTQSSPK
jgi:hypothetical protein